MTTTPRRDPLKDRRAGDLDGVILPLECRHVERTKYYAIFDATGRKISNGYTDPGQTAERMERIEEELAARARRKLRPCLCCGTEIVSEHVGHRMCNPCRRNPGRSFSMWLRGHRHEGNGGGEVVIPEGW